MLAVVILIGAAALGHAAQAKIIGFDPPDSLNTITVCINAHGWLSGYYQDGSGQFHGFRASARRFPRS